MGLSFDMAIKSINSGWDYKEMAMAMNNKGQRFRVFYILTGIERNPTLAECLAIANYVGFNYKKGYFYQEVL